MFEGLKYLYSKNIVHRDIKLANIFVKEGKAKIADFGFAVHARYGVYNLGKLLKMLILGHLSTCLLKGILIMSMDLRRMCGLLG